MGDGQVEGGDPVVDRDRAEQQAVQQGLHAGQAGPHVGADRLAEQRESGRVGGRPRRRHGQHRPGGIAGPQRSQRPAGGIGAIDDDGGNGLAGGRLEGLLPTGVDLDQFEQRADDPVDVGQPLGAGPGPSLVEGHGQGLGPGRPRLVLALGLPQGRFRLADAVPQARGGAGRGVHVGNERFLDRLGLGHLGP